MNFFEERVKQAYENQGWAAIRDGWPDFLMYRVVDGKVELRAVEVKSEQDKLRPNQKKMLALLSTVMDVRDVHTGPGYGDELNRDDMHALVYDVRRYKEYEGGKL